MLTLEAIKKCNMAKNFKEKLVDVYNLMFALKRDNTKSLPSYISKNMQKPVIIMRAVSLLLRGVAKDLEKAGYEYQADHADLASRVLAVAVEDFRTALDQKEREAFERVYNHTDVMISAVDKNRFTKEEIDDVTITVAREDMYNIAEKAIEGHCKGCQGNCECTLKDTMIKLRIPVSQDRGKCPYVNEVKAVA